MRARRPRSRRAARRAGARGSRTSRRPSRARPGGARAGCGGPPPRSTRGCSPRACGSSGATTSRPPRRCCSATRGGTGSPASAAAAWARLRGGPVPPDPPQRAAEPGAQSSLFEPRPVAAAARRDLARRSTRSSSGAHERGRAPGPDAAADRRRVGGHAGGRRDAPRRGCPGAPTCTARLLDELLGERYAGGGEPRRLAELADEVSRGVRAPGAARSARRRGEGVRAGRASRSARPAAGSCESDRPSGGGAADRVQEAVPDLDGPRLVLAPGLGARRPLPARSTCPAARSPAAGPPTAAARCRSPR